MSDTTYERAMDLQVYLQRQAANAYQTELYLPVAADAIQALDCRIEPTVPLDREQHHIGRTSKAGTVRGMQTVKWTLSEELRPAGSAAGEPDNAVLLTSGFWAPTPSQFTPATTINGSWSAYHTGDVTSAANMVVGQVVGFTDSSGNLHGRMVTNIATNTITVSPPLTFLPANGSAVTISTTYSPATTCDERAFAIWAYLSGSAEKAWGCVGDSFKWSWGQNKAPKIETSGFGRGFRNAGPTTINDAGGISDVDTTVTVAHGKRIQPGMVLVIESENVLVTAKLGNVLTITRAYNGTVAAAHADTTAITVYEPASQTVAGSVLGALGCTIDVGYGTSAAATRLESESGSVELQKGVSARLRGHGDTWQCSGYNLSDDATIRVTAAGWAQSSDTSWYQEALDETEQSVAVQFGTAAGNAIVIILPRVVFDPARITTSGEQHVGLELAGSATGSRTGVQAIAIGIL